MGSSKMFFYAKTLSDIFYQLKTISDSKIVAGCTSFVDGKLPEKSLSIRDVKELKIIDKHERYIDLGSLLTLSEIEDLGQQNLPVTVFEAIKTIANPQVRNIATIGGNILSTPFYNTLYASLLALDAKLEIMNETSVSQVSLTKFSGLQKSNFLSKIRIPLEEWEVAVFQRVGPSNILNDYSASFVFLANSQKNQISDLRIAFAGSIKFRDIDLENKIIGAHLPLSNTTISNFLLEAEESFNKEIHEKNIQEILKRQFWNLLKYSLEQLT